MNTPKQNGFGLKPRAGLSRARDLTWALDTSSKKHGDSLCKLHYGFHHKTLWTYPFFFFVYFTLI